MLGQLASIFSEEFIYRSGLLWHGVSRSPKALQKILVNGSPKTGTVWMLRMVTSLPGYHRAASQNFRGDISRYHELQPGDVVHGRDSFAPEFWGIQYLIERTSR